MSRSERWEALLDAWENPILVKELSGAFRRKRFLYLLSCLHEPPDDGAAVLERDEAALRAEFRSLETNAHPHYGGGFRACVRSLRGREIHALLSHVREHARLPPPVV